VILRGPGDAHYAVAVDGMGLLYRLTRLG
jgi:hypothetical protein